MKLEEHTNILLALRIRYKPYLIRILWQIFEEHHDEIKKMGLDEFINKVMPPRRERKPREEKTSVVSVGDLVRKAQAEGLVVTGTRRRRPYYNKRRSSPFYSEGETT